MLTMTTFLVAGSLLLMAAMLGGLLVLSAAARELDPAPAPADD